MRYPAQPDERFVGEVEEFDATTGRVTISAQFTPGDAIALHRGARVVLTTGEYGEVDE